MYYVGTVIEGLNMARPKKEVAVVKKKSKQKAIEQWNEAQKPAAEELPKFTMGYAVVDVDPHKEIKVHAYSTPHGGVEFISDDNFQALKKHLLIEGFVSTQDLIKTIEPELSAIFAEGKADNVADGIKIFLNQ